MTIQRRISIKESVCEDDIAAIAFDNNWALVDVEKATEERPREVIFKLWETDCKVHFIDDYLLNLSYFVLCGQQIEQTEALIRKAVDTYTDNEIRQMAATACTEEEKVRAIYRVGIIAVNPNKQGLVSIFSQYFVDPIPQVRQATILASGYAGIPELLGQLELLAKHEQNPEVREYAKAMVESFKEESPLRMGRA